MNAGLTTANDLHLLENGEEFFPAVFEVIRGARTRVIVETFIIFEDKVGLELRDVLVAAARRGVEIDVTVDGYGTADISDEYVESLTSVGIRFHIFDPQPRRLGIRTNVFHRMHRKIVVVDDDVALVGGINYSLDHLAEYGDGAKQDYAIAIRGPAVAQIKQYVVDALESESASRGERILKWPSPRPAPGGTVALVVRDNDTHSNDIEVHYRVAIRTAKHEILLANAYFFPGYRFLRDLRNAAKRGVRVRLILQGEPDMPMARLAATMLYDYLLSGGVQIYEYCERPLHGKVATVDGIWSTIGSSNLDPLSLALNLEANILVNDRDFSGILQQRLESLIDNHCQLMQRQSKPTRKIQRVFVGVFVFHFLRRFPSWAGWLPARRPVLKSMPAPMDEQPKEQP